MSDKWKLVDNSDDCLYRFIKNGHTVCIHEGMPDTEIDGIELPHCVEKYCPLIWHTVGERK